MAPPLGPGKYSYSKWQIASAKIRMTAKGSAPGPRGVFLFELANCIGQDSNDGQGAPPLDPQGDSYSN